MSTTQTNTQKIFERFEFFLGIINQMCIGFVTIFMTWYCISTGLQIDLMLHAWLVTIGFCFLMAEGIMSHWTGNALTFTYKRQTKTHLHWILEALGGGCGVAGCLIKLIPDQFVLKSIHSKLGFSAFILCLVSMLTGLSAIFSMRLKKLLSPLYNKAFHNLLGVSTFVIALVAQYYGYSFFVWLHLNPGLITLLQCITLVSMVLTCWGPFKALFNKIVSMFN
ncbi:uncharacterized protein LOC119662476 [Teleopsis dalmanni]|uniref:uncharacterized protein LOC119662476 n=1 Tax=Teleopsis dalmanni TaxID=139649 RepID=UPI0018CD4DB0|nr:uncharacterized protein LOC119662476 [Teleopsis dalmanni]